MKAIVVSKQDQIEKHSTTQSVILHLLPGILAGCFYLLARQPVANMGYPSIIALILAYAFILIPVELGYLLLEFRVQNPLTKMELADKVFV